MNKFTQDAFRKLHEGLQLSDEEQMVVDIWEEEKQTPIEEYLLELCNK